MTNRCPITYEPLPAGAKYSDAGLRRLSPQLTRLDDLPYTAEEQRHQAVQRASKMSIQGVQLKLSAVLKVTQGRMEVVDQGGRFILKPPSAFYPELPENEDLTMRLAERVGIDVPLHGLLYAKDGTRTYFIRRFDRAGRNQRLAMEDFAQLSGKTRETKYNSSMEQVAGVLERFATFPVLEKRELLIRTLFNFLCGNEDMHLKNFSLLTREGRVMLAPGYDFLNSTIATASEEELALPLAGKKSRLKRPDFVDFFGKERLGLNGVVIEESLARIAAGLDSWPDLIGQSFLSDSMKEKYLGLVMARRAVLAL